MQYLTDIALSSAGPVPFPYSIDNSEHGYLTSHNQTLALSATKTSPQVRPQAVLRLSKPIAPLHHTLAICLRTRNRISRASRLIALGEVPMMIRVAGAINIVVENQPFIQACGTVEYEALILLIVTHQCLTQDRR